MSNDLTIEARFRRLETQVRRMRWISAAVLVLAGILLLSAMQRPSAAESVPLVRARHIEVVDEAGNVRMSLGAADWGGGAYALTVIGGSDDRSNRVSLSAGTTETRLSMGGELQAGHVELNTQSDSAIVAVASRRAKTGEPWVTTASLSTRDEAGSLHLQDVVRTEDGMVGSETQRHWTRANKYLGD